MKSFIQILSIILLMSSITYAQEGVSKEQWAQFRTANDHSVRIVWDHQSDTFSKMIGKTKDSYGESPDGAVAEFMRQNKKLLGIQENDFDLIQTKKAESKFGAQVYQYQQQYKGVPVLHSGYLISVTVGGFIDYISGDFYDDISLETNPKISSNDVTSIVINDIDNNAFNSPEEPVLGIYPNREKEKLSYQLVYNMDVFLDDDTGAWRYFVDAHSGEVVKKKTLINHETIAENNSTTPLKSEHPKSMEVKGTFSMLINGSGTVYKTSPNFSGTSSQTLYRLDNLSPRKLQGENITVDYHNNTDASSTTGSFNYSTSHAHFDEVMVYYHGDVFEAWLIGKGMGNTRVGKVTAKTQHNQYYAAANPPQRKIFFKAGASGLNNPTKEAAVIAHEYMHVVSETYNDLEYSEQTDAMDEAYSDYFALAYRNSSGSVSSSNIGEYINQSGGINYSRNLNNSWTMDQYNTVDTYGDGGTSTYHEKSVIFSGALWVLRNDPDVSAGIIDELVLESLRYLDSSPSFLDARYALIAAANAASKSAYVDDIQDAFASKGIGPYAPPSTPTNVTITNPTSTNHPNIDWDDNPETNIDYYEVWRQKKRLSDGYIFSATLLASPTSSSYTDTNLFRDFMLSDYDWRYAVKAVNTNSAASGLSSYTQWVNGIAQLKQRPEITNPTPEEFTLQQNYPNPFNPATQVKFALPEQAEVSIQVYNIMGQQVATLTNKTMQAGFHQVEFDGSGLSSGVYIARMQAVGTSGKAFTDELKMQLIK